MLTSVKSAAGTLSVAVAVVAAAITLGNSIVSRAETAAQRVDARLTAVEAASRAEQIQLRQELMHRLEQIDGKVDRLLDPRRPRGR